jgi:uncharacterized protein YcbK (DUF882 family)
MSTIDEIQSQINRRRFLQMLACGSLVAGFPSLATASTRRRHQPPRNLAFLNTHTGERLALTYFEKGRYISDALQEVNYLLRDHRTDDVYDIDTALLDQLYNLRVMLGINKPFHIISGYRSPYTNALLHEQSDGVAAKSLHMEGRAIDIRIEGFSTKRLRNAAVAMQSGGVGYYRRSNFVHLDTGRVRTW